MRAVYGNLVRTPDKIKEFMQVTSMTSGPLAYIWLSCAAIESETIKDEETIFTLMNSILQSLSKTTEHLWYSKIGDLCNAFVKWCNTNGKMKKGLSLVKKILVLVCDEPTQYTNVH